jgi:hypothetical protein
MWTESAAREHKRLGPTTWPIKPLEMASPAELHGFINTLMMQRVLARPHWAGRLTPRDLRAVTPLIWEDVNPYGRFKLDMETRLVLARLD